MGNALHDVQTGPVARARRWMRDIRALPQGTRFVTMYEHHAAAKRGRLRQAAGVVAGLALIALGALQLVIPGPGLLVIALGAALLAREFLVVARWMDRAEVRIRAAYLKVAARMRRRR